MDSKKLKAMISNREGGMKAFSTEIGIANSTLFNLLSSDAQLDRMTYTNFKKVANGLGMTVDELDALISY